MPYEFNPRKRKLAKTYSREKLLLGIANGIMVEMLALLLVLLTGLNVSLKEMLSGMPTELVVPAYAFLLITLVNAAKLPLDFYSGYVVEHKYGLSNYSVAGWIRDHAKRILVGYIIGTVTLTGLFYLLGLEQWWIAAGLFFVSLSILLNYLYPVLLVPFFYKLEPYRNRRHRKKLLALCRQLGVSEIRDVIVVRESEKSKKPNAFFTGFGNTKRIALFDTLISGFTEAEIETVIAHELGHYVNMDVWRSIAIDAIKIFPMLYVLDLVMRNSVNSFGIAYFGDLAALPLFLLLLSAGELVLMPFVNAYSRHREAHADLFALDVSKKPKAQVSTEKRLADMVLADDKPPLAIEYLFWTHPAPWRRIKMAQEWKSK